MYSTKGISNNHCNSFSEPIREKEIGGWDGSLEQKKRVKKKTSNGFFQSLNISWNQFSFDLFSFIRMQENIYFAFDARWQQLTEQSRFRIGDTCFACRIHDSAIEFFFRKSPSRVQLIDRSNNNNWCCILWMLCVVEQHSTHIDTMASRGFFFSVHLLCVN